MASKRNQWMGGQVSAVWQTTEDQYAVGTGALLELAKLQGEMADKWGANRLPLLVPAELREKFLAQGLKVHRAEWYGTLDDVLLQCRRMTNAWLALDRAATDAGHGPPDVGLWEVTRSDGRTMRLARTDADVRRAPAGDVVWSAEELARIVELYERDSAVMREIKAQFAGSTVVSITPTRSPQFVDDEPEAIRI
jgi:hypothetical protein